MKNIKEVQNVVGISEGDDHWNDKNVITIFVNKKLAMSTIKKYIRDPRKPWTVEDVIPTKINGKPTDVVEIGEVKAQANSNEYRPVKGGCEIHNRLAKFFGTAGAPIYFKKYGNLLLLDQWYSFLRVLGHWGLPVKTVRGLITNAHVTQTDMMNPSVVQIGQPYRGGRIGQTCYTLPILSSGYNEFDVSIVETDMEVNDEIIQVGKIIGHKEVQKDEEVHKYGRTTEYTTGKCIGKNVSIKVDYGLPDGPVWFKDLDMYNRISDRGDSGSIIVAKNDNYAVSLLFAGSSTVTFGIPITKIVKKLHISFTED